MESPLSLSSVIELHLEYQHNLKFLSELFNHTSRLCISSKRYIVNLLTEDSGASDVQAILCFNPPRTASDPNHHDQQPILELRNLLTLHGLAEFPSSIRTPVRT